MARRRAALPRVGQLHLRALDRAGTEAQVASLLGTAPHYALVADVFSHTPTPTSRSSSIVDSERWASLVRGNARKPRCFAGCRVTVDINATLAEGGRRAARDGLRLHASGELRELDPVGGAGLVQQIRDVHADGLLTDDEFAGNLAVSTAGDDVREHFAFPGGEAGHGPPLRPAELPWIAAGCARALCASASILRP